MQKIKRLTREPSITWAVGVVIALSPFPGGPIWRRHEALLYILLPKPARKRSTRLFTCFLLLQLPRISTVVLRHVIFQVDVEPLP